MIFSYIIGHPGATSESVRMHNISLRDPRRLVGCSLLHRMLVFLTWCKNDVVTVGRRVHKTDWVAIAMDLGTQQVSLSTILLFQETSLCFS